MHKFVDQEVEGDLLARMVKGGLNASEAGDDEVYVSVLPGEEWADESAWIQAIEAHYACVYDGSREV
jgi:hypothetical protein